MIGPGGLDPLLSAPMKKTAWLGSALAVGLLMACDKKEETKPMETPAASTPAMTASTAPAMTSAPAVASSAPMASASASADAAPGAFELGLGTVKATKGKVGNGERKAKLNLPRMQRQCLTPALKKDASAVGAGTVKMVIDIDDQGKPLRIKTTTEGKVPADVSSCLEKYAKKDFEFDNDAPASLEVNVTIVAKP